LTPIDLSRDILVSENHRDDDKTQTHILLMNDTAVGHYRIVEIIGAGGRGEVHLAEYTRLDRNVALKFLSPFLCQDEKCRNNYVQLPFTS
jgi:serine/threonine protein kinase